MKSRSAGDVAMLCTIPRRGCVIDLGEFFIEMGTVGEGELLGDLCNALIRLEQALGGGLHGEGHGVIIQAHACIFFDHAANIGAVVAQQSGKFSIADATVPFLQKLGDTCEEQGICACSGADMSGAIILRITEQAEEAAEQLLQAKARAALGIKEESHQLLDQAVYLFLLLIFADSRYEIQKLTIVSGFIFAATVQKAQNQVIYDIFLLRKDERAAVIQHSIHQINGHGQEYCREIRFVIDGCAVDSGSQQTATACGIEILLTLYDLMHITLENIHELKGIVLVHAVDVVTGGSLFDTIVADAVR